MSVWPTLGEVSEADGRVRRSITVDVGVVDGDVEFRGELHDVFTDGDVSEDLHWYTARMVATGADLVVTEVGARPIALPFADCPHTIASAQRLVGASVKHGFRRSVQTAMGNAEGCTHLATLIQAMGATEVPASYLAVRDQLPLGVGPPDLDAFVDVCRGWAEVSLSVQALRHGDDMPPRWRSTTAPPRPLTDVRPTVVSMPVVDDRRPRRSAPPPSSEPTVAE